MYYYYNFSTSQQPFSNVFNSWTDCNSCQWMYFLIKYFVNLISTKISINSWASQKKRSDNNHNATVKDWVRWRQLISLTSMVLLTFVSAIFCTRKLQCLEIWELLILVLNEVDYSSYKLLFLSLETQIKFVVEYVLLSWFYVLNH